MKHATDIELEQYLDETLNPLRKFTLSRHLNACDDCKKRLDEAKEMRVRLKQIGVGLARLRQADDEVSHSRVSRIQPTNTSL